MHVSSTTPVMAPAPARSPPGLCRIIRLVIRAPFSSASRRHSLPRARAPHLDACRRQELRPRRFAGHGEGAARLAAARRRPVHVIPTGCCTANAALREDLVGAAAHARPRRALRGGASVPGPTLNGWVEIAGNASVRLLVGLEFTGRLPRTWKRERRRSKEKYGGGCAHTPLSIPWFGVSLHLHRAERER